MTVLYKGKTRISSKTNRANQRIGILWLEESVVYLMQNYYVDIKRLGNEKSGGKLSWNEFDGKW